MCAASLITPAAGAATDVNQGGDTEGSLQVSERGSATYTIPIKVAPGTAGHEPKLALRYDSSSAQNGPLGLGFSLAGLSSITRCGKTLDRYDQRSGVTYSTNDRLCLDGEPLLTKNGVNTDAVYWNPGMVYGTEEESWRTVRGVGDCRTTTCSFDVKAPDGSTWTYGTGNAFVEGEGGRPAAWLASRVVDRNGNVMTVAYITDQHVTYPQTIDYAGRSVALTWEVRTEKRDIERSISPGYERQQRLRLASIEAKVGTSTFRRYDLSYGLSTSSRRSRIERVVECDGSGACLAPIELEWNDSARDGRFEIVPINKAGFTGYVDDGIAPNAVPGDYNGDGQTDLIMQGFGSNTQGFHMLGGRGGVVHSGWGGTTFNYIPGARLIPGDYDGDGITDFIRQEQGTYDNDNLATFRVFLGRADHSFVMVEPSGLFQSYAKGDTCLLIPADVNGDGRTDLLRQERGAADDDLNLSFQVWLSQGGEQFTMVTPGSSITNDPFQDLLRYDPGARIIPGDFNGDGWSDFLGLRTSALTPNLRVYFSRGDGTFDVVTPSEHQAEMFGERINLIPGDFNGDGRTDFLRQERGVWDNDDVNTFGVYLSRGDGTFQALTQAQAGITRQMHYDRGIELIPGDFNGDGKTDFIGQERNGWASNDAVSSFSIFYANGDGSFDEVRPAGADYQDLLRATRPGTSGWGADLVMGDFDADGRTDFIRRYQGGGYVGVVPPAVYFSDAAESPPEHTVRVFRSGNGLEERVTYSPLSRAPAAGWSAYDPSPTAPGTREVRASRWVVSWLEQLQQTNGNPLMTLTSQYRYAGAAFDPDHGFLGFAKVTMTSAAESLVQIRYYKADPTFRGRLEREETRRLYTNELVAERRLEWQQTVLSSSGTRLTRLMSERTIDHEGGGALENRTDYRYDLIGKAVLQIDTGFDGSSAYVCRSYSYDPASFGQPLSVETSTACTATLVGCSCAGERLSRTEHSYDSRGNIVQRESYDSEHAQFLVETFEYDAVGNQTVAVDPAGVREVTSYDTALRTYPVRQVVDPDGKALETRFAYDPRFGALVGRTDPSGATAVQTLDTFGRLVASSVHGGGEPEATLETRRYLQDGPLRVVEISHPEAGAMTRVAREYSDYLGRKVREEQGAADGRVLVKELAWNHAGQLVRESEAQFEGESGIATSYEYDARRRPVRVTTQSPVIVTTLAYAVGGAECAPSELRVQITQTPWPDAAAARTRVECRNHRGDATRRVFIHDGGRPEQRIAYDLLGRVVATSARDGAGNEVGSRTEYTYDTLGRKVATLHSQKGLAIFHHGVNGRLAAIETPAGVVTREYDSAGRLTAELYADGSADRVGFDEPAFVNAKGRMTRLTKILPGGQVGAVRTFGYDRRGRVAAETVTIDGRSFAFGYRYRADDERAEVTYPDGSTLSLGYDGSGNLERLVLDGVDYATYRGYNAKGQAADVQYGNGVTSHYDYDAAARLREVHTIGRDDAGAPRALMERRYDWNGTGEIGAIADLQEPDHTQTFTYDRRGYLVQAVGPYGTLAYGYDDAGNLVQKEGVTFTYAGDRPVGSSNGDGFAYDARGNRTRRLTATETIQYAYSPRDELTEVRGQRRASTCPPATSGGTLPPCDDVEEETLGVYEYDAAGARVKKTDRSGAITLYVSPLYEVTIHPGGPEMHTRYLPGPAGRVAAITEEVVPGAASTSGALAAGVNAAGSGGGGIAPAAPAGLAFDPRLVASALGLALALIFLWFWVRAAARQGTVGRARHAVLRALVWSRILDGAAADRGDRAEGAAFLHRNRRLAWGIPACAAYLMATIAGCGQPTGNVTGEPGIRKVWSGELGVAMAANGLAHAEVGSTMLVGNDGGGYPVAGTHFFHLDHVGSSTLVTDALGRELSLDVYKPYGELDESSSRGPDVYRSKFAGKEWDDGAELYYFEARHYDPYTGRFLQADTLAFGSDTALASDLNRYAYAGNNPIVYSDPSGRCVLMALAVSMFIGAVLQVALDGIMAAATGEAYSWRDVGISIAIGATTGMLGFGAGQLAGGMARAAITFSTGSLKLVAIQGAAAGFAGGFSGDVLGQMAEGKRLDEVDYGSAVASGAIGAAVGGVSDPFAARASRELVKRGAPLSVAKQSAGRTHKSFADGLRFRVSPASGDDLFTFSVPTIVKLSTGSFMPRSLKFLVDESVFTRASRGFRRKFIRNYSEKDDDDDGSTLGP